MNVDLNILNIFIMKADLLRGIGLGYKRTNVRDFEKKVKERI